MKSDDVFHLPLESSLCPSSSMSISFQAIPPPPQAVRPSTRSCEPLQTISAEANWKVTFRPSEKASIHGHDCASSKRHFQPRLPEHGKPVMFGRLIGLSRFSLASRSTATKSRGHKKVQIIFTFYLTTLSQYDTLYISTGHEAPPLNPLLRSIQYA